VNIDEFKRMAGFTFVEMIVVIAILGVVMTAIYSIFLTHQKAAYTQEDVVEVQQNLRVAMDAIARDLKMAGILVEMTGTQTAPVTASVSNYSTALSLNTGSAAGHFARITRTKPTTAFATYSTTVESPEATDMFTVGDTVRIIRPLDSSQPIDSTFSVDGVNRAGPSLVFRRSPDFAAGVTIQAGDMVAKTGTGARPDTIIYSLVSAGSVVNGFTCPENQSCLKKSVNGVENIIGTNLAALRVSYILDDATETTQPTDTSQIRSVRVTLTGKTSSPAYLGSSEKTRQITSVIMLRNRR